MRKVSFFVMLWAVWAMYAQTTQTGIVQEYNEKSAKTPLAGVELNVRSANSTVSDKNGAFELQFLTLKPGEKVNVRRIEKLGYEIFNKEAVEQWNINPTTPFVIVMCRSDRFKKIRDNYERVSSESYARQLKKEEAALAKLKSEGKLKEAEYEQQLNLLRENYENQLDNLDSYVDRFSRIDLSELSSAEQAIIELVQQGRIDEAIEAYENLNLADAYKEKVVQLNTVGLAKEQLNTAEKRMEEEKTALRSSLLRQIEMLRLAGGQKNFRRIGILLKEISDADTTNVADAMEYAYHANHQKQPEEAKAYFERAYKHGDAEERFIAKLQINSLSVIQNYENTEAFENLYKMLFSKYCKLHPEIKMGVITMMIGTQGFDELPESKKIELLNEIESFKPTSLPEAQAKYGAAVLKTMYLNSKGYYKTTDEYKEALKSLLDYGDETIVKYGEIQDIISLEASVLCEYFPILLSEREFDEFDKRVSSCMKALSDFYHNNPVQHTDIYNMTSMYAITRTIFDSDPKVFENSYRNYLADVHATMEMTPDNWNFLMATCYNYTMGMIESGIGDYYKPLDVFLEFYPPEKITNNHARELVSAIICLFLGQFDNHPKDKYEKITDNFISSNPELIVARVAKGQLLYNKGNIEGAKEQLKKIKEYNPDYDLHQVPFYELLYGNE